MPDTLTNGRFAILAEQAAKRMASQSLEDLTETDLLLVIGQQMAVRHEMLLTAIKTSHGQIMEALQAKGVKVALSPQWAAGIGTVVLGFGAGVAALAAKFQWW